MNRRLLTLLLFIPVLAVAQSNYKPGYVVNLKGDTLRGLVNYREWDYTPKNIDFKTTINDKPRQLGIKDINCFEIDGLETYKGYTVKISMDVLSLRNLSTGIDTSSRTEPVFLKVLETGKNVTLYGYTDLVKSRYYIKASSEGKPSELIYKQYLDPETVNTVITVDTYHRQLTSVVLVLGINNLNSQIQRTRYTAVDLMAIVLKLNGTSEKAMAITTTPAPSNWRLFAGVALNISTLKYDGDSPFPNASGTSTLPAANLGFDFFVNPTVGRLIIRVEAGFAINDYTATSVTNSPFGWLFHAN